MKIVQGSMLARFRLFRHLFIPLLLLCGEALAQTVAEVRAGQQIFQVEIASDLKQRKLGLMGRYNLKPDQGLLMIFENARIVGIWMKQMQFSLDVVWISSTGKVIDIQTLHPCKRDPCPVYRPDRPAQYVLEVGAGIFPLKVGEGVEILDSSRDSLLPPSLD